MNTVNRIIPRIKTVLVRGMALLSVVIIRLRVHAHDGEVQQ